MRVQVLGISERSNGAEILALANLAGQVLQKPVVPSFRDRPVIFVIDGGNVADLPMLESMGLSVGHVLKD